MCKLKALNISSPFFGYATSSLHRSRKALNIPLAQGSPTFLIPWTGGCSFGGFSGCGGMVSCTQPKSCACTNDALHACLKLWWFSFPMVCSPVAVYGSGVGDPYSSIHVSWKQTTNWGKTLRKSVCLLWSPYNNVSWEYGEIIKKM